MSEDNENSILKFATNEQVKKAVQLYYTSELSECLDILNSLDTTSFSHCDSLLVLLYKMLSYDSLAVYDIPRKLRFEIIYKIDERRRGNDEAPIPIVQIVDLFAYALMYSHQQRILLDVFVQETIQDDIIRLVDLMKEQNPTLSQEQLQISLFAAGLVEQYFEGDMQKIKESQQYFKGRYLEDFLATMCHVLIIYNGKRGLKGFEDYALQLYERNPKYPLLCYQLGIYYFQIDYEKSLKYFKEQILYCNKNPLFFSRLLNLFSDNKKQKEFDDLYEEAILLHPGSYYIMVSKLNNLIVNNKEDQGVSVAVDFLTKYKVSNDEDFYREMRRYVPDYQCEIYEKTIHKSIQSNHMYEGVMSLLFPYDGSSYQKMLDIIQLYYHKFDTTTEEGHMRVYYKISSFYKQAGLLKEYVDVAFKFDDTIDGRDILKLNFDQQALDSVRWDHSKVTMDYLDYFSDSNNQGEDTSANSSKFFVYFQNKFEDHLIVLQQLAFRKELKDISIFQKDKLLIDLYY